MVYLDGNWYLKKMSWISVFSLKLLNKYEWIIYFSVDPNFLPHNNGNESNSSWSFTSY